MTGQEIYQLILESNLINFLIMLGTLVWIFKKFNLGKYVDSIAYDIKNNVTSSAEAVQNALNEYKKTKKNSKNVEALKEKIINDAKETIQKLEQKTEDEIDKKEKELDLEFDKTKEIILDRRIQKAANDVQDAIYRLSVDTVKGMLNEDVQKRIILGCLDELNELKEAEL